MVRNNLLSEKRLSEMALLPDEALVSLKEATAYDAVSLATGWRRIRSGVWIVVRVGGSTRISMGALRAARKPTKL